MFNVLVPAEFDYYGGGIVVNFVARPVDSVRILTLGGADLADKFHRTGLVRYLP